MAKGLTRNQENLLLLVIQECKENGPPTLARIEELDGRRVHATLGTLAAQGYLRQPYPKGPWVPLLDLDGTPLRLELTRITSG